QIARELDHKISLDDEKAAHASGDPVRIAAMDKAKRDNRRLHFNNLLDAAVAATFLVLVAAIVVLSIREWILLLARKKVAELRESPPVWLPEFAMAEAKPLRIGSLFALVFALAKELSGESQLEHDRQTAQLCACDPAKPVSTVEIDKRAYVEMTEKR